MAKKAKKKSLEELQKEQELEMIQVVGCCPEHGFDEGKTYRVRFKKALELIEIGLVKFKE